MGGRHRDSGRLPSAAGTVESAGPSGAIDPGIRWRTANFRRAALCPGHFGLMLENFQLACTGCQQVLSGLHSDQWSSPGLCPSGHAHLAGLFVLGRMWHFSCSDHTSIPKARTFDRRSDPLPAQCRNAHRIRGSRTSLAGESQLLPIERLLAHIQGACSGGHSVQTKHRFRHHNRTLHVRSSA